MLYTEQQWNPLNHLYHLRSYQLALTTAEEEVPSIMKMLVERF